jgi:hypothetical protein
MSKVPTITAEYPTQPEKILPTRSGEHLLNHAIRKVVTNRGEYYIVDLSNGERLWIDISSDNAFNRIQNVEEAWGNASYSAVRYNLFTTAGLENSELANVLYDIAKAWKGGDISVHYIMANIQVVVFKQYYSIGD